VLIALSTVIATFLWPSSNTTDGDAFQSKGRPMESRTEDGPNTGQTM